MEAVYFFTYEQERELNKVLDQDFFKRIGPTLREAKILGIENRDGFFVYLSSPEDSIKKAEELLKETAQVERLYDKELEEVINKIKVEDKNAQAGMGLIFG